MRLARAVTVVTAAAMVLAGCGDDDTPQPEAAAPVDDPAEEEVDDEPELPEEPPEPDDADDDHDDAGQPGGLRSASIRDPLRSPSDNFQEAEFEDGRASLAFVDDTYRMISPGGPLVSPLQDDAMAQTVEVEVEVTVNGVDQPGLAGVACGIGEQGAYLFVAGIGEDDQPFWSIGYLDVATGGPVSLRDANLSDTPSGDEVVPPDGEPFTLGGRCERGSGGQAVALTMTVDGEEVASVGGDEIVPLDGQVGLFAIGQSAEPFEVSFNDFVASGRPDGVEG